MVSAEWWQSYHCPQCVKIITYMSEYQWGLDRCGLSIGQFRDAKNATREDFFIWKFEQCFARCLLVKWHANLVITVTAETRAHSSARPSATLSCNICNRIVCVFFVCLFVICCSLLFFQFCVEAETKWPPFSRRHFQVHLFEWKCMNFD